MDAATLAAGLLERHAGATRVVVGIAGIPGSGKTTLATSLKNQLGDAAVLLPMDGFHLTRSQLDALDNPAEAHRRRGAPFTFDAAGLVKLVNSLKSQTHVLFAPSFDHSVGDPVFNAIQINTNTCFIIVEGIYLHLSLEPWNQMMFDERLTCSKTVAVERLAKRHFEAGVEKSPEDGHRRATESDMLNADIILANRVLPCQIEIPTDE